MESTASQHTKFNTYSLSEDQVKQRFIPFLKDFYRNRYEPMPNSVEVQLDNVSAEGAVADGLLRFKKSNGEPFVCTYEATSRDKALEVTYTLNSRYFQWDCLAFSALCTAIVYTIFYQSNRGYLINLHITGNLGFIIGLGLIFYSLWFFTMRSWRKYRFIHAIAQFKTYHADEQWIALAEDVFPAVGDPYLLELKNQCIYNGIGLAIVPGEGPIRKINDPSRLSIYGKDRKMADWFTQAQWYQQAMKSAQVMRQMRPKAPDRLTAIWNIISRPIVYLFIQPMKKIGAPLRGRATVYTHYMRAQPVQKMLTALSLLLIAPLFYQIASYRAEQYADLEALKNPVKKQNPEEIHPYITRNADEWYPSSGSTGLKKQNPTPIKPVMPATQSNTVSEVPEIEISTQEEPDAAEAPATHKATAAKADQQTARSAKKQTAKSSAGCGALQGKTGWIIQDNVFSVKAMADERVAAIKKAGLVAQAAPMSCIGAAGKGYLVYIGALYGTEKAARDKATAFEAVLKKGKIANAKMFVRKTE